MAFSLSKQGNTNSPTKKINKVSPNVPKINKEKPPNPNKSAGVQEQFRATVSAIEEEKKRMFSDKPNYLLNEKLMNFARTGSSKYFSVKMFFWLFCSMFLIFFLFV